MIADREIKVFNLQGGQQTAWSLPDESLPSWAGVGAVDSYRA